MAVTHLASLDGWVTGMLHRIDLDPSKTPSMLRKRNGMRVPLGFVFTMATGCKPF